MRRRKGGIKGSEGFLFQISLDPPEALPSRLHPQPKINRLHQKGTALAIQRVPSSEGNSNMPTYLRALGGKKLIPCSLRWPPDIHTHALARSLVRSQNGLLESQTRRRIQKWAQLIIEDASPSTSEICFSCSYITALLCCSVERLLHN